MSIQKQLVPILIPDPLPVEERYTPTGKVIVGYGPFHSDRIYLLDLPFPFHVLLQPKASRINIAPPLDSLQVRDSYDRGFNTFLFKNNERHVHSKVDCFITTTGKVTVGQVRVAMVVTPMAPMIFYNLHVVTIERR